MGNFIFSFLHMHIFYKCYIFFVILGGNDFFKKKDVSAMEKTIWETGCSCTDDAKTRTQFPFLPWVKVDFL